MNWFEKCAIIKKEIAIIKELKMVFNAKNESLK